MDIKLYITKDQMTALKKALRDGDQWTVELTAGMYESYYGSVVIDLASADREAAPKLFQFTGMRIRHRQKLLRVDSSVDKDVWPDKGDEITFKFNNQQRRQVLRKDWSEYCHDNYEEYDCDYSDDYSR